METLQIKERHFATLVLLSADNVENWGSDCAERFPHSDPQLDRQGGGHNEKSTPDQLEIFIIISKHSLQTDNRG